MPSINKFKLKIIIYSEFKHIQPFNKILFKKRDVFFFFSLNVNL